MAKSANAKQRRLVVECRDCEASVAFEALAEFEALRDPQDGMPERFVFGRCPKCSGPLLVGENSMERRGPAMCGAIHIGSIRLATIS